MTQTTAGSGRLTSWHFGDYAVAGAANGRLFAVGFGDGTVHLFDSETPDAAPVLVKAHTGACLSLTADIDKGVFLSGGDDGKVVRIDALGTAGTVAEHKGRWIEHVTAHAGSGVRAYAAGKDAFILSKGKKEPRTVSHPSAVAGLAINPKGKRLAVSHYNAVTLWWLAAQESAPVRLEWQGSHLQLAWSPDGDYILSAMQENALHGWRLSDGEHMRMTGYAAKIRAISFTRRGHFLATGGSESVVCWPFTGGGPMGKPPVEFGDAGGAFVTAVLANPKMDVIAAGFENGDVLLGQPGAHRTVPIVKGAGSPVTVLVWTPDGDRLLMGTETGDLHMADFRG